MDIFGDDLCAGLRRELAEHHELDPLRHAVEQRDGALQSRVLYQAAVDHVALVISELGTKDQNYRPDVNFQSSLERFIRAHRARLQLRDCTNFILKTDGPTKE